MQAMKPLTQEQMIEAMILGGLSIEDIASKLGVSKETIRRWRTSATHPRRSDARRLRSLYARVLQREAAT